MTPLTIKGLPEGVEKLLHLITATEGTDKQGTPYNELFGYTNFTDFSKHPNKSFYLTVNGKQIRTTAAGRWQITYTTYKDLGMKSFTPLAQDEAAVKMLKMSGAYQAAEKADWTKALKLASGRWASLPYSDSGQPKWTLTKALQFFDAVAIPDLKKEQKKTNL